MEEKEQGSLGLGGGIGKGISKLCLKKIKLSYLYYIYKYVISIYINMMSHDWVDPIMTMGPFLEKCFFSRLVLYLCKLSLFLFLEKRRIPFLPGASPP